MHVPVTVGRPEAHPGDRQRPPIPRRDADNADGNQVTQETEGDECAVVVAFGSCRYTYELTLRYLTSFEAQQAQLAAYSAIVEGFRLDVPNW